MPHDQDPTQFENEIALYEKQDDRQPPPEHPILFFGSSSIRFWRLKKYFPAHHHQCLNRGFGGSGLLDALYYFDRLVLPYQPQALVLYTGENDLGHGAGAEDVIANSFRFVEKLQRELPRCQLLLLPIKPSPALWGKWPEMQGANTTLAQIATNDARVDCIDVATPMIGSDQLPRPELYMKDQLHMSSAGYELWSDLVTPWLERVV